MGNTFENPNAVNSQPLQTVKISEGKASVQLPPLSVAAITLEQRDCLPNGYQNHLLFA